MVIAAPVSPLGVRGSIPAVFVRFSTAMSLPRVPDSDAVGSKDFSLQRAASGAIRTARKKSWPILDLRGQKTAETRRLYDSCGGRVRNHGGRGTAATLSYLCSCSCSCSPSGESKIRDSFPPCFRFARARQRAPAALPAEGYVAPQRSAFRFPVYLPIRNHQPSPPQICPQEAAPLPPDRDRSPN